MPRAYLWVPADVVVLDLVPSLRREERRLIALTARARRVGGTDTMVRRTAELVGLLHDLIAEVRALPPHDAAAALILAEHLRLQRARLGRRWPCWLYARVEAAITYRLLPHDLGASRARDRQSVPVAHLQRAAWLRRRGRLVLTSPSPSVMPSFGQPAPRDAVR